MFVPSLSWQNYRVYIYESLKKERFPHLRVAPDCRLVLERGDVTLH
jgi:hypothetical protein